MRSINDHPASLALGLALGITILLSMGQVNPMSTRTLNVQYVPHPRDMVQIYGGTPYTVPTGRLFVLTGLGNYAGTTGTPQTVGLLVNGQREVTVAAAESGPSVKDVPVGFTASAGSIVEVVEVIGSQDPSVPRAWGYLAPQ